MPNSELFLFNLGIYVMKETGLHLSVLLKLGRSAPYIQVVWRDELLVIEDAMNG